MVPVCESGLVGHVLAGGSSVRQLALVQAISLAALVASVRIGRILVVLWYAAAVANRQHGV